MMNDVIMTTFQKSTFIKHVILLVFFRRLL